MIKQLSHYLLKNNLKIAVAESCTAGALSAKLTSLSGSSAYFDRGFITYSNQAKMDMLNVQAETINNFGAVSEQVVSEMAKGVIKYAQTDIAIAISGIAGPTGTSQKKPVGTVCFCFHIKQNQQTTTQYFYGNRDMIIKQSINFALLKIYQLCHTV